MPANHLKKLPPAASLTGRIASLLVVLAAFGCVGNPGRLADSPILEKADQLELLKISADEQKKLAADGRLYRDPSSLTYVNAVVLRIQRSFQTDFPGFGARILSDPLPNAYAYPDGAIYITTGLLARLESEAQLAAVLAHEMAHCINRDAWRAHLLSSGAAGRNPHFGPPADRLDSPPATGLNGILRRFELEADAGGLDMLVRANYDPRAALEVFDHQREALAVDGRRMANPIGSHPFWRERVAALEGLLAARGELDAAGDSGAEVYNRHLQPILLHNARLNLQSGRPHWARLDVERYLQLQPGDPQAHFLMGETLQRQGGDGCMRLAQASYQTAIRLDNAYAAPHTALGLMYFKQGRRKMARHYFENSLALAPADADSAYIRHYLAECRKEGE